MPQNARLFWVLAIPVLALLVALRVYLLSTAGQPDFDSIRNWEITQEIANGNFQNLYHHRSPLFFLFFSAFVPVFSEYHFFIYLNGILQVAAILLFTVFCKQIFKLSGVQAALLLLCVGTSVFLVYSARFFSIESPALLLFVMVFRAYYLRFQEKGGAFFLQAVAWLAVGLTVNYKFLLLLPVAFLFEVVFRDGVFSGKLLSKAVLILIAPFAFFMVFSWLVGQPFYKYSLVFAAMFLPQEVNAANRIGSIRLDVLYYFRYLLHFESPVTWLGLLTFPAISRRTFTTGFNKYSFVFGFTLVFLAGMSVLLKAPRGLLFIYPLLYLLGFLALRYRIQNLLLFTLTILGSFLWNVFLIRKEIYAYAGTGYPKVAAYLKENKISKIVGTASLSLKPYLDNQTTYKVVLFPKELKNLKMEGYTHILLDDSRKVTNITAFDSLEKIKPVFKIEEKSLRSKLLFLEYSEFTGFTYNQTLALRKIALRDTLQLKIIPFP